MSPILTNTLVKSSKLWSSQLWTQIMQLRIEAWKIQNFNGVWIRDLTIPVRCSNQLSYEATDIGSWSFVDSHAPMRNECEITYEYDIFICHFTHCSKWRSTCEPLVSQLSVDVLVDEYWKTKFQAWFAIKVETKTRWNSNTEDLVVSCSKFWLVSVACKSTHWPTHQPTEKPLWPWPFLVDFGYKIKIIKKQFTLHIDLSISFLLLSISSWFLSLWINSAMCFGTSPRSMNLAFLSGATFLYINMYAFVEL